MPSLSRVSRTRRFRSALFGSVFVLSGAVMAMVGCRSDDTAVPDLGSAGNAVHPPGSGGSSGASSIGSGGTANHGGASTGGIPGAGGTANATGGTGNTTASAGTGGASSGGTGGTSTNSGGMSSGGAPTSTGGTSTSSGGMSSGGAPMSSGGSGGMGTGGALAGGGGMGAAGRPCVDVEPPADPNWPGATCVDWASQTTECTADWFATYCDVSCGRCVPEGGSAGSGAVDCSTMGLPNVTGGDGFATRYWDCCQTHCGQSDGHRCAKDGVTRTSDTNSACNGGGSYACYDEAPHAVNDCLSYGYIAKANPNCGGCYRIQFTGEGHDNASDPGSKLIKGKQMIVKVSNTGGDVASNQFDVMVPGGGVGKFNACSNEWGTSDLGAQYGGFFSACTGAYSAKKQCAHDACMKLPSGQMRDGCIWFTDWLQAADNPKFTSQATDCPF